MRWLWLTDFTGFAFAYFGDADGFYTCLTIVKSFAIFLCVIGLGVSAGADVYGLCLLVLYLCGVGGGRE